MVTKGLATLAIAASLVTATAGIVSAHNSDSRGSDKGSPRGIEMKLSHRAEGRDEVKGNMKDKVGELTPCTFAALDKRDMSDIATHEVFHAGMKTALSARKVSMTAALAITDETARKEAVKKAGQEFRTSIKKLEEVRRSAQKSAQTTFKTEREACGEDATSSSQS